MIGKRDDRRKTDADKKIEEEKKKSKEEVVQEMYVSTTSHPVLLTDHRPRPQMPSSMFFQHNSALVPVSSLEPLNHAV